MDHLVALEREMAAFEAAARRGPLDAPVAACPEWTAGRLVAHLGEVHRWAAHHVTDRPERIDWNWSTPWSGRNDDPAVVDWYREGADRLVAALRATDPATPTATFGDDRTTAFWRRRQAHETVVHRWDLQSACGTPDAIDGDLAADGVDEFLHVFAPRRRRRSTRAGGGESLHLHRTDGDGEWFVRFDGDDVVVERAHLKGDVALRGGAADLLLWLWMRADTSALDVMGDQGVLDVFRELVPPT